MGNTKQDTMQAGLHLQYIDGDLFSVLSEPSVAICHCVSADFRMGKGIALEFRRRFKNVDKLIATGTPIGEVAILQWKTRFIYYLVTKERYSDKPTLETLRSSLADMKAHLKQENIKKLAMPRIGVGLDRLLWKDVEDLITELFAEMDITITVYSL